MDIPYKPGKLRTNRISFLPRVERNPLLSFVSDFLPHVTNNPNLKDTSWDTSGGPIMTTKIIGGKSGGGDSWNY